MKNADPHLYLLYDGMPVPTVILGPNLAPIWLNEAAKIQYPIFAMQRCLDLILTEEQQAMLPSLLEQNRCFQLPIGPLGPSMVFMPYDDCRIVQMVSGQSAESGAPLPMGLTEALSAIDLGMRLPLSRIFFNITQLSRQLAKQEISLAEQTVGTIDENAYGLLRFATELSSYLRCIYGGEKLRSQPFDLAALLREIEPEVTKLLKQAEIPFVCSVPAAPVILYGDRELFEQALLHLISNSCRYTREGNRIMVHLETNTYSAQLTVTDRGAGISAEHLRKILGPFCSYETDGSVGTGVGLGLCLAQHTMALHGGILSVSSEEGEGTIVKIRLPLYEDDAPLCAPQENLNAQDEFSLARIILSGL